MKISVTRTDAGLQVRLYGDSGQFELALNALKQDISRQNRKFDAERRCWMIDYDSQAELECWLKRMRAEMKADVVYKNGYGRHEWAARRDVTNAYATLHLLPTAPPELVKAAYRCLAMMNHPDVGGDTETMQQLNIAYAQLSARRV